MEVFTFVADYGGFDREGLSADIRALTFTPAPEQAPDVGPVLAAFGALMTNGDAVSATLRVHGLTPTVRAWLAEERHDDLGFVLGRQVIFSGGARQALPVVYAEVPLGTGWEGFHFTEPIPFELIPVLTFAGHLANALHAGGAYTEGQLARHEAQAVSRRFCDQMLTRLDDFHVLYCDEGWCPWFSGVIWDHTWLITNTRAETVTMICVTDSD